MSRLRPLDRVLPRAQARARVLLVGSGRMGHIRAKALYSNPRLELAGVVDADEEGAARLGGVYRAPHYRSLEEAIHFQSASTAHRSDGGRPALHGAVLSTPTPTHEPLITEAASHGLHVFAEKPIDETAEGVSRLFSVARRAGVELCCGFQRRFDPSYRALFEKVRRGDNGGIGTPLTANMFFGDHPAPPRRFLLQGGGNIIADCAAHDVDFIRWTLGDEVERVYATGTSSDDELRERGVVDNATMVMTFRRGTVATLTLSRGSSYGYDQRCEVFGTDGLASVRNVPEHFGEVADASGVRRPRWTRSFPQRFEGAFYDEMDAFADVLLGDSDEGSGDLSDEGRSAGTEGDERRTKWPVTEEDCVAVQRVCDAAVASCESGEVVRLDHPEDAMEEAEDVAVTV
ncbi:hypothetical protein ACHAWF_002250 [Thalassiosira exigua]